MEKTKKKIEKGLNIIIETTKKDTKIGLRLIQRII